MTFQELADVIDAYCQERDRNNLSPSDIAKSIILEGAELLEHFQWDETLKNKGEDISPKSQIDMMHEVADILIYLMEFCRETNIDIVSAVKQKIEHIKLTYPARKISHIEHLQIKKQHRLHDNNA